MRFLGGGVGPEIFEMTLQAEFKVSIDIFRIRVVTAREGHRGR